MIDAREFGRCCLFDALRGVRRPGAGEVYARLTPPGLLRFWAGYLSAVREIRSTVFWWCALCLSATVAVLAWVAF